MKKKALVAISGYFLFIILFMAAFYLFKFPEKILFERIKNREGYSLQREEEPVTLTFFVKPEWIDQKSEENKELNIEIMKQHGTTINLDYVMDYENILDFGFRPIYELKESGGEFLANTIFNEDNTFTTISRFDEFVLYDLEHNPIPVGQTGQGSNSEFSFVVPPEHIETIKSGFYVEYSGFYLYQYDKQ